MRLVYSVAASVFFLISNAFPVGANSCSATNEVGDSCSISCPVGQSASCMNGVGVNPPRCECSGTPTNIIIPLDGGTTVMSGAASADAGETIFAQTDIVAVVNARLATLRDYQIDERCERVVVGMECNTPPCGVQLGVGDGTMGASTLVSDAPLHMCPTTCWNIYAMQCSPVMGKLSIAGAVQVVGEPTVAVEPPNWEGIPRKQLGVRKAFNNCSSEKQSYLFSHSQNVTVGAKVAKLKTVTAGVQIGAKVGFSYGGAPGFGGSGEVTTQFSRSVSVSDSNEETYQENRTLAFQDTINVPSMRKQTMVHFWTLLDVPVRFSGTVTVDAPVNGHRESVTMLSQLLPDASDRTFEFEGIVLETIVADATTDIREEPCVADETSEEALTEPFFREVPTGIDR